jgi:hypothetical protein
MTALEELKDAYAKGKIIQIWRLNTGATSSSEGYWDDADPLNPVQFTCPIHLYRVKPDPIVTYSVVHAGNMPCTCLFTSYEVAESFGKQFYGANYRRVLVLQEVQ